ncbi:MAG: hypothetical protein ACI9R3_006543 [Verrucomicrobiales bacterium]|jgi:hypothetical protein
MKLHYLILGLVTIFLQNVSLWAQAPEVPRAVASPVKLGWSSVTRTYEFDSRVLFGCIEPHRWYHGLAGLVHRDWKVDAIRPLKSFLNAEYYLSVGSGTRMIPRKLSRDKKTIHKLQDGGVRIHFPEEPVYGFSMDLTYRVHSDMVDMDVMILPSKDVEKFEIFFASYVVEAFSETWVPLKEDDGSSHWYKLENRTVMNRVFGVVRDEDERELLGDGRWGESIVKNLKVEAKPFSHPILIAHNPENGFALVFLCDPVVTSFLGGQYHGWDTAHDWSFGSDLVAGQAMNARVRLVYRHFNDPEAMQQNVMRLWQEFGDDIEKEGNAANEKTKE